MGEKCNFAYKRSTMAVNEVYIARINKAIDFFEKHMSESLNLADFAREACFSPFHFHRIFSLMTSETPYGFMNRLRIEKAASMLISDSSIPVNEIAYACGFSSQAVFSSAFKRHFEMSAAQYRKKWPAISDGQIRKNSKIDRSTQSYFWEFEPYKKWKAMYENNICVKHMPEMHLIYCRHTGPYHLIGKAYERLMAWAGPKGLLTPDVKTMTVYHDDPNITIIEKLRQSACITVSKDIKPEGEFGSMKTPAGLYAVGRFEISVNEFEPAWNAVCAWLIQSKYQPVNGLPYELYHNNHEEHPEGKFVLDICVPVNLVNTNK